jgi:predicted Zn finger-like uncharacterized protein
MIVSCPHCSTNFKVPEAALGRMMKCARCGHVWKATASAAAAPSPAPARPAARPAAAAAPPPPPVAKPKPKPAPAPAAPYNAFDDEIPLESPPTPSRRSQPDPVFEDFPADDPALSEMDKLGFTGEGGDPFKEDDEDDPFGKMSELMSARLPESMPDMFSPPRPKKPLPRRKGAFILWVLVLILVLAAAALGLYFFQDRLLDHYPTLSKYYEQVGARRDEIGAGLSFRNYNSERLVQDNNEVLIVRGVIANGTEQKHEIPLLRLALYNGAALLQEKIISPPQASLDGKATVGFKVTLEQPSADATRFEVTFIAPKAAGK